MAQVDNLKRSSDVTVTLDEYLKEVCIQMLLLITRDWLATVTRFRIRCNIKLIIRVELSDA